ncbi:gdp-mannose 4 6 dehydratase [Lucifera butyrica]|uniref:Gdp-mannose 4 6 dehydratase n=1 Tax=Lucifera butyrica TaxID=1351585 RepID=A0A498R2Z9_9FIRM|nr:CDP-glucose 4,6-dehydratase [Lucifera butyrica]VBB05525.1 gdp-mannose 4 6 dehydratase [Lucifera butyrica]
MEGLVKLNSFWQGKRVLITGHTGFKGSWLSLWLQSLGAEVIGYALQPPSNPSLFSTAQIADQIISIDGNILDLQNLSDVFGKYKPELVFHLAAQTLVRHSYKFPVETLMTNVMGTANVLEATRRSKSIKVVVNVTSDKCYENREWVWGYRETEPMGGFDPYSCSKGCAELITSSFRRSYFSEEYSAQIGSVRAGNVIGGGDWAADRIIPDCVRAIKNNKTIILRSPKSIRPWQHVLEPLFGYLLLAEKLWNDGSEYAEGWNFGPENQHAWTVEKLVATFCNLWGRDIKWAVENQEILHEALYLRLDSAKAYQRLGWRSILSMQDTIRMTVDWYRRFYHGEDPRIITLSQIEKYESLSKEMQNVR